MYIGFTFDCSTAKPNRAVESITRQWSQIEQWKALVTDTTNITLIVVVVVMRIALLAFIMPKAPLAPPLRTSFVASHIGICPDRVI